MTQNYRKTPGVYHFSYHNTNGILSYTLYDNNQLLRMTFHNNCISVFDRGIILNALGQVWNCFKIGPTFSCIPFICFSWIISRSMTKKTFQKFQFVWMWYFLIRKGNNCSDAAALHFPRSCFPFICSVLIRAWVISIRPATLALLSWEVLKDVT